MSGWQNLEDRLEKPSVEERIRRAYQQGVGNCVGAGFDPAKNWGRISESMEWPSVGIGIRA